MLFCFSWYVGLALGNIEFIIMLLLCGFVVVVVCCGCLICVVLCCCFVLLVGPLLIACCVLRCFIGVAVF